MVLMDYPNLHALVNSIASALRIGGHLLATIPNPYVWPRYWRYERRAWFAYQSQVGIQGEFTISSGGSAGGETTHYHRPLATYLGEFQAAGFSLRNFVELTGNHIDRIGVRKYPRFIGFELEKTVG
jgi:hypothetical protein